jgi:hypothetical protein
VLVARPTCKVSNSAASGSHKETGDDSDDGPCTEGDPGPIFPFTTVERSAPGELTRFAAHLDRGKRTGCPNAVPLAERRKNLVACLDQALGEVWKSVVELGKSFRDALADFVPPRQSLLVVERNNLP